MEYKAMIYRTMKCRDCGILGEDFNCPDVEAILCDDCYTTERVTIMHEHNLKDLFEVDEYLNRQDVI